MIDNANLPKLFRRLTELECLNENKIYSTSDGLFAAVTSIADILACRGITCVTDGQGDWLECSLFFDDWYLYAVADGDDYTYSLFKMREQEYDRELGMDADGDIPGVTISFIALQTDILLACLEEPGEQNGRYLNDEINRVVAYRGQSHNEALKQYFIRTEAQGAYLIANLYTEFIASLAQNGYVSVPEHYDAECLKRGKCGRLPCFIEQNNADAGKVVCDHQKIYIGDPLDLTEQEKLAILATHTGNTSFFSFAAEVQFHAKFLSRWAKIPIPIICRSVYDSAIRADMSIGDAEFVGPTPYYRPNSRIVRAQYNCHKAKQKE